MSPLVTTVVYIIVSLCAVGTFAMLVLRDRLGLGRDLSRQTEAVASVLAVKTAETAKSLGDRITGITDSLATLHETAEAIHLQTKLTNGRVTALEARTAEDRAALRGVESRTEGAWTEIEVMKAGGKRRRCAKSA